MPVSRALAGLAAAAILLTGCTSAAPTPSAPVASASASASASEASLTADAFINKVLAGMQSVTSYRVESSTTTGGNATTSAGVVKLENNRMVASHLTLSGETDTEILVIGGDYFMKSPQGWVKLPESMTKSFDTTQADQAQWLRANQAAITGVELVGSEQVDGAPAERYHVTLDMSKLPDAKADAPQAGYDAWLDAQGRMVKAVAEVTAAGTTSTTEVLLSDFNEPVDIEAPADYVEMPS